LATECIAVNRDKIAHEIVEDEVIIINLETGAYYHLRETGVDVWRAIEQGASREQLIEALAERSGAGRDAAKEAASAFVDELAREEIVVFEPGDGASPPLELGAPGKKLSLDTLQLAKYTNMSDLLLLDPIHDVDEQGWPHRRAE
jgi:hypothetical protein